MRQTRLIILFGIVLLGAAATYYPGGLGRYYGDDVLTTLLPGAVYFNTSNETYYAGGASSNPVPVGAVGFATTGDIAAAVSGITTNLTIWDGATNAVLVISNGLIKAVTGP